MIQRRSSEPETSQWARRGTQSFEDTFSSRGKIAVSYYEVRFNIKISLLSRSQIRVFICENVYGFGNVFVILTNNHYNHRNGKVLCEFIVLQVELPLIADSSSVFNLRG